MTFRSSRRQFLRVPALMVCGLSCIVLTSCLEKTTSLTLGMNAAEHSHSHTDPHPSPEPSPSSPSPTFSWNPSTAVPVKVGLGVSKTIPVQISAGSFSGRIKVHVEADEIAQIDPTGTIKFTAIPDTLDLTPGSTPTVNVTVVTDTRAPDFNLHFHLVAVEDTPNPQPAQAVQEVQFGVDPIYEVRLYGGPAPEGWDLPKSVSFRQHTNGITVRFVNMDSSPHRVHSSGAIPHQLSDMAANGGVYEYKVTNQSPTSASVYCHSHEASAQARTLNFNVSTSL